MIYLILFVLVVWLLSYGLRKAGEALERRERRAQAHNEALDLAVLEAAGALNRIADALDEPSPPPVSARLSRAKEVLSHREEVREAMARELGVR